MTKTFLRSINSWKGFILLVCRLHVQRRLSLASNFRGLLRSYRVVKSQYEVPCVPSTVVPVVPFFPMATRSDCRRHFPRLQFDGPKPHPFRCSVTTTGTSTIYEHMFRSFGLRENPFHVSPDPRFLFFGPAYETALAELMFGIESHRGLLVLTGEAGTGKTTLIRHFLQWLKTRQFSSSYIFHAHLDPADLFEFILRDFGVEVDS